MDNNNNNDDIPDPLDVEEKEEQEPSQTQRKTSKYMTKYERARILGTRALQIRSVYIVSLSIFSIFSALHGIPLAEQTSLWLKSA